MALDLKIKEKPKSIKAVNRRTIGNQAHYILMTVVDWMISGILIAVGWIFFIILYPIFWVLNNRE